MTADQAELMLQPELTEDRALVWSQAYDFCLREVLPVANRLDPEQAAMPPELVQKLAQQGYFGIMIDEDHGGLGMGVAELCLVSEALSRGWLSVGSIIARGNGMFGLEHLDANQKAEVLPRVAAGDWLSAVALSEPDVGSDLASIACRAERDGDDWIVTGNKYWCTFADGADYILLFARTASGPEGKGHQGISSFAVPKPRGQLPDGVSGSPIPKIGYFGWNTWELRFEGTRLPGSALVGEEGRAFYYFAQGLDVARAQTAARALGLARGALEDSIAYVFERRQFGQDLAAFQDIRFKLASMASRFQAAHALTYQVADALDRWSLLKASDPSAAAAQRPRLSMQAAMAKLTATDMAQSVTNDALQIFGGAGYTKLHAVERYWRDARLTQIFEGTNEIQKRIISDALLGRG